MGQKKVLMVCMGNICRSPMAEAIFQDMIDNAGLNEKWAVESAAIGCWDVGNPINYRAVNTMKRHDLNYNKLKRARKITKQDFQEFDYIFGMDPTNMEDLKKLAPTDSKAKCLMLGDFGLEESDRIIEDPYRRRGEELFEKAFEQCVQACGAFLKEAEAGNV